MNGLRFLLRQLIGFFHHLIDLFLSPFYAVGHFFSERFARFRTDQDDEFAKPRSRRPWWLTVILLPVLLPLWTVTRVIPWIVFAIFHPRNRKALLLGTPALLVAGFALLALSVSVFYPKQRLIARYEIAGRKSFNAANWDRAQLYYEKLCYLEPSEDMYRFRLAMVREQKREFASAYGIMAGLAPLDEPGFPWAHLWMARTLIVSPQILSFDKRFSPEDRPRLIRYHLETVLQEMPDNPLALRLKAQIVQNENPDEALAIYRMLAPSDPRLNLQIASMLDGRDDEQGRNQVLDGFEKGLEESFQQRPVPVTNYVDYVTSKTMRREYPQALNFITAYAADVRPEIVNELRANVLVAWANQDYSEDPDGRISEVLVRLTQALRIQPNQPQAYALLSRLVQGSPEHREKLREACEDLIAEGINSGMVQLILGSILLADGEYERAELTLRLALSLDPKASATLNNLAWLYAFRPEPDYDRALELINRAIQIDPQRATYYDTRGRILLAQGSYADAIVDLERAHQGMPENPDLLRACAQAHEALGNKSQALAYRKQIEKLLAPANDNSDTPDPEGR